MKTLMLFLLLGGFAPSEYWFCGQVGHLNGEPAWVVTQIFQDDAIDEKEKERFSKVIESHMFGQFKPSFEVQCMGFQDEEGAKKHLIKRIKKADKRKILVRWINWFATE